ncbi:MAG TPA: hypothetical protein VKB76_08040 [Ktedonobacterales bacterium]|nr:hypothetical protein [Ktedonobacterales bacterium]
MAEMTAKKIETEAKAPPGGTLLAVVMIAVATVTVVYWIVWFLIPGGRDALATLPHDQAYIRFENAFPAADGWLSLAALVAAIQILRGQSSAIIWMFVGGGAGLYLAGMDVLYDLENGVYRAIATNPASVGTEIAINVATIGISLWVLWWASRNRDWLCRA